MVPKMILVAFHQDGMLFLESGIGIRIRHFPFDLVPHLIPSENHLGMRLSFRVDEGQKFMDFIMLFGSQANKVPLLVATAARARDDMVPFAILTFGKWVLLAIQDD